MLREKPTPLQLFKSLVARGCKMYITKRGDIIKLYIYRNGDMMQIDQLIPDEALDLLKMIRINGGLMWKGANPPEHMDLWIGSTLGNAIWDTPFSARCL